MREVLDADPYESCDFFDWQNSSTKLYPFSGPVIILPRLHKWNKLNVTVSRTGSAVLVEAHFDHFAFSF